MGIQSVNNSLRNFKLGLFSGSGGPIDPLEVDLVAYYTLDETTGDRIDCSVNGLDASVNGTVGFSNEGILNGCAEFTLAGGLKTSTASIIDSLIGSSFTITTWVRLSSDTSGTVVGINKGGLGGDSLADIFYDFNSKSLSLFINDGAGGDFFGVNVGGSIPFDAWVFLVVKFDADTENYSLQLNEITPVSASLGGPTSAPTLQKIVIGRLDDGGLPFDGCIDETSYYSRLLDTDEVAHYFRGGGLLSSIVAAWFFEDNKDDEGPNAIELFSSGGFGFADGVIDRAGNYNGNFARLDSAANAALDALRESSFSVTMFAYVDSGVSQDGLIFSIRANNAVPNKFITVRYNFSTDAIDVELHYNGGATSSTISQDISGSIPKNTFFAIQVTFDEPTLTLRMRLNVQAFASTVLGSTTNNSDNQRIAMGAILGSGENLFGRVDELYIFNEVRTDIQLNTTYMNGLATRPYLPARAPCAPALATQVINGNGTNVINGNGTLVKT